MQRFDSEGGRFADCSLTMQLNATSAEDIFYSTLLLAAKAKPVAPICLFVGHLHLHGCTNLYAAI